jgi:hypothetical protein
VLVRLFTVGRKYPTETAYGKKCLFWLTVSEVSVHDLLASLLWAGGEA